MEKPGIPAGSCCLKGIAGGLTTPFSPRLKCPVDLMLAHWLSMLSKHCCARHINGSVAKGRPSTRDDWVNPVNLCLNR